MILYKHQENIYNLVCGHDYAKSELKIALVWGRQIGYTELISAISNELKAIYGKYLKIKSIKRTIINNDVESLIAIESCIFEVQDEVLLTIDLYQFNIQKEFDNYLYLLKRYDIVDVKTYENTSDTLFDKSMAEQLKNTSPHIFYKEIGMLETDENIKVELKKQYLSLFNELKVVSTPIQLNEIHNKIKVLKEFISIGEGFTG